MELTKPLAVITPTLDGEVLAILALHDAVFTTGQVHRMLPSYSEEGIRKVLRRLTGQGIVLSERIGNAFAYRFNRDHIAAEHVTGLARIRETFLARLEDRLAAWPTPPKYAAVFGSAARGDMKSTSDIDLCLIRPDDAVEPRWEDQLNDLSATVSRWLGNDARVLEFTETEVVTRGRQEPVLHEIMQEGLTVAGSKAWLITQLRKG